MEQVRCEYSQKNIPIPNINRYKMTLLEKIESLITRMRWKAFFYLSKNTNEKVENYGFRTNKNPPQIKEMVGFEADLTNLIKQIKPRKWNNKFQNQIKSDLVKINQSKKVYVKADKTSNMYAMSPEKYKRLLKDEITKFYKKAQPDTESKINNEALEIASKLKLANRINKFDKKEAFITLKDTKDDFVNKPKCRLLNPTKTEMGRISKKILQEIGESLRNALNVEQWRNTAECIKWFNEFENHKKYSCIKYDIKDFYPSINEKTLNKALKLAKEYVGINDENIAIIKHCRKTVLFHDNELWVKKGSNGNFDVSQGSYDGAEICELVGILLLHKLNKIIDPGYHGLYRDDGLIMVQNGTGKKCDTIRKKLIKFFQEFDFKIEVETNLKVVDYLDITFDLNKGTVRPYKKQKPIYINVGSNHPKQVFKHIPNGIANRLSTNSSDSNIFNEVKIEYEKALKENGYKEGLTYHHKNNPQRKKNRGRNIIYFTPPFNAAIKNNIGKYFFGLVKKHFPKENVLYKVFNKNNLKLSYSTMPNFIKSVKSHNNSILNKHNAQEPLGCNCRRLPCIMNGRCREENIIYKATVKFEGFHEKFYIGSTSKQFKTRYSNHKKSFKHKEYKNETTLSKYVWMMREKIKQRFKNKRSIEPEFKWEIIKRVPNFKPGDKFCRLCANEKMTIIMSSGVHCLNKRSEIILNCMHTKSRRLGT